MAFKSMNTYNKDKYRGTFKLANDGDSADVIFLYRSEADVLECDAHYIKSVKYSGYVHCNDTGCPACAKNLRRQSKIFIPLYNIMTNEIVFWDRTVSFYNVLIQTIFRISANPSEYVFRITRRGEAKSRDTKYEIQVVGKNSIGTYDEILKKFDIAFPEHYNTIVRQMTNVEMSDALNSGARNSVDNLPDYTAIPRVNPETSSGVEIHNLSRTMITNVDEDLGEVTFD